MTTNKLTEYNREIQPKLRELEALQQQLKDFKDADVKAQQYIQEVKDAQQNLKQYLDDNDVSRGLQDDIKELSKEIKLAVKAAKKGTDYTVPQLTGYFKARKKAKVQEVVDKGELFDKIDSEVDE